MNPFDILKSLVEDAIRNLPEPVKKKFGLFPQSQPQNTQEFMPSEDEIIKRYQAGKISVDEANRLLNKQPATTTTPTPAATSTPNISPDILQGGLNKFAGNQPLPISNFTPQLTQAGEGLPDPLLPTILALMESGGGRNVTSGANNIYNISPGQGISYPDLQTAILGGGPQNQQGLTGVLQESQYNPYRQSGNLADFFNVFTPPGSQFGNPELEELLNRYNQLKSLFIQ